MLNLNVTNIANNGREIYVWHRIGKTLSMYKEVTFKPYFYQLHPQGLYRTIDGKRVNKVVCYRPSDVKNKRDENSYEADVFYTKRFIIDKVGLFGKVELKYSFPDIEVLTKELPNYLYPDQPISCISYSNNYTGEIKTFFLLDYDNTLTENDKERIEEIEKQLLDDFVDSIKQDQFDLILGWNFIDFDWRYLQARYKKVFGVELAEMLSPIAQAKYLGGKEEVIPNLIPAGMSVMDYLEMYKKIYKTESSYALDAVAQKELKEEKYPKVDFSKLSPEIKEKNINDIRRMMELEKQLKIIDYYDELRRMSMCEWSDVTWNCLDDKTKILTQQGWKTYKDLKKNDLCFSMNPKTKELELININKIFIYSYKGYLINYEHERVNFQCTKNHRFLMDFRKRKNNYLIYKEANNIPKGDNYRFIIGTKGYDGSFNDLTDNQIRLIGWIITEGHFEKKCNGICIYQNRGEKADEIQEILDREQLHYYKYFHKNNKSITFRISSKSTKFYKFLLNNKKELPDLVYNLPIEQKIILLETMIRGDGHWQSEWNGYFCSKNKCLIEQFQLLCTLAGWNCFNNNRIKRINNKKFITYYANISIKKLSLYRPHIKKEKYYNGKIWCISNKYENFIIKRNNKIMLSGNSKMIDMILLKEAKAKGIILPSKHYGEDIDEETFEGAYRRCDTGLYKNLWKLDLGSAYPQAIINFCLDVANIKNEGIEINGTKFYQNSGALLPTIAQKLVNKKDVLKKQLKATNPKTPEAKDLQIKYDAIKAVVNSLFGVCGLKIFRLFDYRVASAITFIIRDLLHYVEDELKKRNIRVIYVDTDSVFIEAKDNPLDLCNQLVRQWALEKYKKNNIDIEFDLEGTFDKIFIVALCHYDGDLITPKGVKHEQKGIEAKRKDSSDFIRQFQNNLIEKIKNEEPKEEIVAWINSEKARIKTLPLIEVGYPCRISKMEGSYKSIPIFLRGFEYTKELITFEKVTGDSFYWINVIPFGKAIRKSSRNKKNKETGKIELQTSEKEIDKDVLCFDEDQFNHIKEVNWDKVIKKSITGKCEAPFLALGWDLNEIKREEDRKTERKRRKKE